jgi:hypothetical protein
MEFYTNAQLMKAVEHCTTQGPDLGPESRCRMCPGWDNAFICIDAQNYETLKTINEDKNHE